MFYGSNILLLSFKEMGLQRKAIPADTRRTLEQSLKKK
jgi:hypothetical protein